MVVNLRCQMPRRQDASCPCSSPLAVQSADPQGQQHDGRGGERADRNGLKHAYLSELPTEITPFLAAGASADWR